MNSLISAVCLAACIAGLLVILINIAVKLVGFIAKAIVNEPCRMNLVGEVICAFIFSFIIALFFLV
jgi:hypothetical protein